MVCDQEGGGAIRSSYKVGDLSFNLFLSDKIGQDNF